MFLQCIYATYSLTTGRHQDKILGNPLHITAQTKKREINANTSANNKGPATGNNGHVDLLKTCPKVQECATMDVALRDQLLYPVMPSLSQKFQTH